MPKGEIKEYPGMRLTCGGVYWVWPWWKRVLSTFVFWPYGHYGAVKGTLWKWRHPEAFSHLPHPMPRGFYYQTLYSTFASRVRPIYWGAEFTEKA